MVPYNPARPACPNVGAHAKRTQKTEATKIRIVSRIHYGVTLERKRAWLIQNSGENFVGEQYAAIGEPEFPRAAFEQTLP